MEERLQKFLAQAGVASRRAAEELIQRGEVLVNGSAVDLGTKVDPESDVITYRGRVVQLVQEKLYLMLNKPTGVVTTAKDPQGRRTVLDLLPAHRERLFPVGRLDRDTTGLLILTNDGDFAHELTHPKFKVEKCYRVTVKGAVQDQALLQLQSGIMLEDGITAPAEARVLAKGSSQTVLEVVIREGRKRQVRRMCAAVGHPVLTLERVRLGSLQLGDLPMGQARRLTPSEVAELRQVASHGGTSR